jgi:hypothetical protein
VNFHHRGGRRLLLVRAFGADSTQIGQYNLGSPDNHDHYFRMGFGAPIARLRSW